MVMEEACSFLAAGPRGRSACGRRPADPPRAAAGANRTGPGQADRQPAEHAGLRQLLRRQPAAAVLAAGTIAVGGRGLGTLSTYIPAYLRSGLRLPTLAVGTPFTLTVTYAAAVITVAAFGYAGRSLGVLT